MTSSFYSLAMSPSRLAPESTAARAWPRYRDNLARHLIGIARDLQLRLMRHLQEERGHRGLRPSFGLLVALVAQAPRPLSRLARELAISPQAASQLVALAERAGYLARSGDPDDRRARRAVLTPQGERLVADAVAFLQEIEADHARRIGDAAYHDFLATLAKLVRGLDLVPLPDDPRRARAGLLPILAAHAERELMRATGRRGHAGLKLSHGQILPLVGPAGARLRDLAALHGVSRQAISATAQDLEALGHLRREPDPNDRRGVVVRLTAQGTRLIADSVEALDELEQAWAVCLAPGELAAFARAARALYLAQGLEAELLSDAFDAFDAPRAADAPGASGAERAPSRTAGATRGPAPSVSDQRARSARAAAAVDAGPGATLRGGRREALARLAARLRDRLGERDAARLAAQLVAQPANPSSP